MNDPPTFPPALPPAPTVQRFFGWAARILLLSFLPETYAVACYYNSSYGYQWREANSWVYWITRIPLFTPLAMAFFYLILPTFTLLGAMRVMRKIRKNRPVLKGESIAAMAAVISIFNLMMMFTLFWGLRHFPAQT